MTLSRESHVRPRLWWAIIVAYFAPIAAGMLLSIESVWYGQGLGKLGGPAIIAFLLCGIGCSLFGLIYGELIQRILGGIAASIYLLLVVGSFF